MSGSSARPTAKTSAPPASFKSSASSRASASHSLSTNVRYSRSIPVWSTVSSISSTRSGTAFIGTTIRTSGHLSQPSLEHIVQPELLADLLEIANRRQAKG